MSSLSKLLLNTFAAVADLATREPDVEGLHESIDALTSKRNREDSISTKSPQLYATSASKPLSSKRKMAGKDLLRKFLSKAKPKVAKADADMSSNHNQDQNSSDQSNDECMRDIQPHLLTIEGHKYVLVYLVLSNEIHFQGIAIIYGKYLSYDGMKAAKMKWVNEDTPFDHGYDVHSVWYARVVDNDESFSEKESEKELTNADIKIASKKRPIPQEVTSKQPVVKKKKGRKKHAMGISVVQVSSSGRKPQCQYCREEISRGEWHTVKVTPGQRHVYRETAHYHFNCYQFLTGPERKQLLTLIEKERNCMDDHSLQCLQANMHDEETAANQEPFLNQFIGSKEQEQEQVEEQEQEQEQVEEQQEQEQVKEQQEQEQVEEQQEQEQGDAHRHDCRKLSSQSLSCPPTSPQSSVSSATTMYEMEIEAGDKITYWDNNGVVGDKFHEREAMVMRVKENPEKENFPLVVSTGGFIYKEATIWVEKKETEEKRLGTLRLFQLIPSGDQLATSAKKLAQNFSDAMIKSADKVLGTEENLERSMLQFPSMEQMEKLPNLESSSRKSKVQRHSHITRSVAKENDLELLTELFEKGSEE